MKNAILISSAYDLAGHGTGTFEMFFRNLAAGLNRGTEKLGWKTHVVPKTPDAPGPEWRNKIFETPASLTGRFLASVSDLKRRLETKELIDSYSKKLAEYSDVISRADIIHAHDPAAVLAYARMRGLNSAAKVCLTPGSLSGLGDRGPAPAWLREMEAGALGLADYLIVPSGEYLAAVDKVYGPLGKPYVILPGLHDEKYLRTGELRRKIGVAESMLLIAAFYAAGAEGDAEFFVDAFAAARTRVPDRIFGAIAGLKTPVLEAKIKKLGLEGSFALVDAGVPRGEVLAEADIFFSNRKFQVLDLGAIEAFRAGLAVVVSDERCNAEASGYGEAAMLFKAGDAVSAGCAFADIALDPAALIHFSSKARDYFRAQYTLDAFARRGALAYEDMLKV